MRALALLRSVVVLAGVVAPLWLSSAAAAPLHAEVKEAAKQAAMQPSAEAAIRVVLAAQVAAWNRADIDGFMAGYEDSPETTFVSTQSVEHGFQQILARYRRSYATQAQMGTLSFRELAVRLLPTASGELDYAVVTGRFHLERTTHGAAARDDGIFSLLWRKTPTGWKIILDHTA